MKLWIGEEGKVYETVSIESSDLGCSAFPAGEEEGKVGFLCQGANYIPVAYHSGKWVTAHKTEMLEFYDCQNAEWLNYALTMPLEYRLFFLSMIEKGDGNLPLRNHGGWI